MDEHGHDAPSGVWTGPNVDTGLFTGNVREGRKYLPTLADLIDRLSIVQLKEIYIGGDYAAERKLIEHDIDIVIRGITNTSTFIRAVMLVMLSNRVIWENESKARAGGSEQDKLLKFTHSINGCRNRAKNIISQLSGERVDLKTDCLAADLPPEFGNWDIFK